MRRTLAAFAAAAMLSAPMAALPQESLAQTTNIGDNLVNVQLGDITILRNANVAVAANVVAALCDVADVTANILAVDTSTTGQAFTCSAEAGDVTVTQNAGRGGPGNRP